jgi:hypothetical protein
MSTQEPYRPSNGTEGWAFASNWCARCTRDKLHNSTVAFEDYTDDDLCKIYNDATFYSPGDDKYPPEWRYNSSGEPCCTAYAPLQDTP